MTALLSFVAGPLGRWLVIGLAAAAIVTAFGMRAYSLGYAKHEAETSAAIAEANSKARIAEREASERMAQLATDHQKEVSDAQAKIDSLRADVRSGARRLSVPAGACVPVRTDPAITSGDSKQNRAELDGATADALVAIAADGDNAIRQANSLIDAYAVAREVCGK